MPHSDIVETLEMVSKAKTREEKRQILKDRENFATKLSSRRKVEDS